MCRWGESKNPGKTCCNNFYHSFCTTNNTSSPAASSIVHFHKRSIQCAISGVRRKSFWRCSGFVNVPLLFALKCHIRLWIFNCLWIYVCRVCCKMKDFWNLCACAADASSLKRLRERQNVKPDANLWEMPSGGILKTKLLLAVTRKKIFGDYNRLVFNCKICVWIESRVLQMIAAKKVIENLCLRFHKLGTK